VFPGNEEDGSLNYSSLDSQHDRLIEKMGFSGPLRLYDLRHTGLTRLAESGADVFSIQKIAGRSDIRVTSRYVHPTPEHIKQAFSRLQEYNKRSKECAKGEEGPRQRIARGRAKEGVRMIRSSTIEINRDNPITVGTIWAQVVWGGHKNGHSRSYLVSSFAVSI